MYISQIVLRNWRSYKTATFQFPAPATNKNIVLIGALNGYGKTSLFQAILLGMFGEDGMALIENTMFSEPETARRNVKHGKRYKDFIEGALHRGAIPNGDYSCSIELGFINDDGKSIEILRTWHFNDSGNYEPCDEEIKIYEGENRTPVGLTNSSSEERKEWYRDYIERTFLPPRLASFFVFDGEQVRVLAELEMASQVRLGIEGLLGIPDLRDLSKSLKDYAIHREKEFPKSTSKNINKMSDELEKLTASLQKNLEKQQENSPKLSKYKEERKKILEELFELGVGAQTQSSPQYQQLAECESTIKDSNHRLDELLSRDIALALSGAKLHTQLKFRLDSENIRERWLNGKQQGDSRIDNFLAAIDKAMDSIEPPINTKQQEEVLSIARTAWVDLWFPPPENCADDYLHPYLNSHERNNVINQLNELGQVDAKEIADLSDSISKNERRLKQIRDDISRLESTAPDVDKKRVKLEELNSKIDVFTREAASLGREREGLDGQINAKNADLAQMHARVDSARPAIRRAGCARAVAAMLDEIVAKAVPNQTTEIAKEITKAHKSISHKKMLIDRIAIDEKFDVKLLNVAGVDVRRNGLSAGEEQIFTQSLFSAVATVSQRTFPMVVDTPLARLDVQHRKGMLKHLANLGRQVILLSTDTEVVNEYLAEIEANIQKKYRIDYHHSSDIGHSDIVEDYFENMETTT